MVVVWMVYKILPENIGLAKHGFIHGANGKVSVQLVPVPKVGAKVVVIVGREIAENGQQVQAVGKLEGAIGEDVVVVIIGADIGNQGG